MTYIDDTTAIAGVTWAEFKEEALAEDFKEGVTFVSIKFNS